MKSRLIYSVGRLGIALAIFVAAVAPSKLRAISCTNAWYGDQYCTQCWVNGPLGWQPVGGPEWTSAN